MNKTPPHDLDAEKAVLGAALLDKRSILHQLDYKAFYRSGNGLIYKAILELDKAGEPVDYLTLIAKLKKEGNLDRVGGAYYITLLTNEVPSLSNAEYYAKIVTAHAERRLILNAALTLAEGCYSSPEDSTELLGAFDATLSSRQVEGGALVLRDTLLDDWNHLEKLCQGIVEPGIATGFYDLDAKMQLCGGELTFIAGRPGMGKTGLGLGIASHMAANDKKVLFCSLEMSTRQLTYRLMSAKAAIDGQKFRVANFNEPELKKLGHAVGQLANLGLFIDPRPGLSSAQIFAEATRVKRKYGLDAVIVDHLHLMREKGNNKHDQVGAAALGLSEAAKKLDIPIIVLAQLNRGVEQRLPPIPSMSDIRESGTIEEIASQILLMYRQDYYVDQGYIRAPKSIDFGRPNWGDIKPDPNFEVDWVGKGILLIAKSRSGSTGKVKLIWNGPHTRFLNEEYRR